MPTNVRRVVSDCWHRVIAPVSGFLFNLPSVSPGSGTGTAATMATRPKTNVHANCIFSCRLNAWIERVEVR